MLHEHTIGVTECTIYTDFMAEIDRILAGGGEKEVKKQVANLRNDIVWMKTLFLPSGDTSHYCDDGFGGLNPDYAWLTCHELAYRCLLPAEVMKQTLTARTRDGKTTAHILAERNQIPREWLTRDVLSLSDDNGWTVAHVLAMNGFLPKELISEEILFLSDNYGSTVAHVLAMRGCLPRNFISEKLLKRSDRSGWMVAHELALLGVNHFPQKCLNNDIVRLKTKKDNPALPFVSSGWSVLHCFAYSGSYPDKYLEEEYVFIEDDNGLTVMDILKRKNCME